MSGLVQHFQLEAQTSEQLELGIKILQGWHPRVTHYVTGKDNFGTPFLSLLWATPDRVEGPLPLIAPMTDAGAIRQQLQAWLLTVDYGKEPDHDGSNGKGYHLVGDAPLISGYGNPWGFYSVLTIYPKWIEYHK